MWNALTLLLLILYALMLPGDSLAGPFDHHFGIDFTEAYFFKDNYLDRDNRDFSKEYTYNRINIHPSLVVSAGKGVYGYLGVDFSWQTEVEEDDDEVTADATMAYLSLNSDHLSVDLGLQPIQFGNGLIMADDTLSAVAQVNMGDGYAKLEAARVMDHSPMVGLTMGYRPGYFERLEIFGIWYSDRDDTFANTTPILYQVLFDLSSEGHLYYFGAAADLFVGNALLSLVGAYQTGHYTITRHTAGSEYVEVDEDVSAYFGDISLQQNLTNWCTAELFCFVASGDAEPQRGDLEAFVSITPYNSRAAIFFDPDFLDLNDSERFTYGGGFARGVIAPGLNLTLSFYEELTAEAELIYMFADQALDDGSRCYGWEVGLNVSYTIGKHYKLFVEAARFEHGDFSESFQEEKIDPAVWLSAGLCATF